MDIIEDTNVSTTCGDEEATDLDERLSRLEKLTANFQDQMSAVLETSMQKFTRDMANVERPVTRLLDSNSSVALGRPGGSGTGAAPTGGTDERDDLALGGSAGLEDGTARVAQSDTRTVADATVARRAAAASEGPNDLTPHETPDEPEARGFMWRRQADTISPDLRSRDRKRASEPDSNS